MDVNELRRQHQELSVIAGQLLRSVEDDSSQQSIGPIRWHLTRQLMAHLALEDRIFYPAVQRLADERARTTALRLQAEIGTLAQNFSAYMHRWSDDQVAREWAAFCVDTRAILTALSRRMEQEEKLLYPLVEAAMSASPPLSRTG